MVAVTIIHKFTKYWIWSNDHLYQRNPFRLASRKLSRPAGQWDKEIDRWLMVNRPSAWPWLLNAIRICKHSHTYIYMAHVCLCMCKLFWNLCIFKHVEQTIHTCMRRRGYQLYNSLMVKVSWGIPSFDLTPTIPSPGSIRCHTSARRCGGCCAIHPLWHFGMFYTATAAPRNAKTSSNQDAKQHDVVPRCSVCAIFTYLLYKYRNTHIYPCYW